MLSDLFANELQLEEESWKRLYHMVGGRKTPLNRDTLPHGYSAVLDILSAILAQWKDFSIPLSRMRGVILIDEIEAHLHVRMQKEIIPCLIKLFPNVQFIITTHSPYILNSVSFQMPSNVRIGRLQQVQERHAVVYDMEKCEVLKNTEILAGWSIEGILKRILGVVKVESKELEDALREYDQAVNKALQSGFPYNTDDNEHVHAAYKQLDMLLALDNPLRQVLEIQMVEFGGVRND